MEPLYDTEEKETSKSLTSVTKMAQSSHHSTNEAMTARDQNRRMTTNVDTAIDAIAHARILGTRES
jgi:hypothetical protein